MRSLPMSFTQRVKNQNLDYKLYIIDMNVNHADEDEIPIIAKIKFKDLEEKNIRFYAGKYFIEKDSYKDWFGKRIEIERKIFDGENGKDLERIAEKEDSREIFFEKNKTEKEIRNIKKQVGELKKEAESLLFINNKLWVEIDEPIAVIAKDGMNISTGIGFLNRKTGEIFSDFNEVVMWSGLGDDEFIRSMFLSVDMIYDGNNYLLNELNSILDEDVVIYDRKMFSKKNNTYEGLSHCFESMAKKDGNFLNIVMNDMRINIRDVYKITNILRCFVEKAHIGNSRKSILEMFNKLYEMSLELDIEKIPDDEEFDLIRKMKEYFYIADMTSSTYGGSRKYEKPKSYFIALSKSKLSKDEIDERLLTM